MEVGRSRVETQNLVWLVDFGWENRNEPPGLYQG